MRQAYYADRIGEHRAKTPEGFLIALGVPLARTGFMQYRASELQLDNVPPDTLINVYRDASAVFEPAAISSFEGKSLTKNHPSEFLNPNNDRTYAIGHVQNVRRGERLPDGEEALIGDVVVKDAQAIQYIETGVMDQLSAGYTYNLSPLPDSEHSPELCLAMRDIRGNHLALVNAGRAGKHVKVLDAAPEEGSSTMEWKDFVAGLKEAGLRLIPAKDAESEAVKTQEEKDKEALELKSRVEDSEEEKKEKEEKKAQDAAILKALSDNTAMMKKVADGLETLAKKEEEPPAKEKKEGEDAKCTCDAEEGEAHKEACPMFKKVEDADLIPVATLPKEDRPKNPIPGADTAIAQLRTLKPFIAASGDAQAIRNYNRAMDALKNGKGAEDAYKLIEDAKNHDVNGNRVANDSRAQEIATGASFEEECKKHHRKVVIQ